MHSLISHHSTLPLLLAPWFISTLCRQHAKLELKKPCDTRFAYCFILLKRIADERDALEKMLADDEYKAWVQRQDGTTKAKHDAIKESVHSKAFWVGIGKLLDIVDPIVDLMLLVDSNSPSVSKVYHRCVFCVLACFCLPICLLA